MDNERMNKILHRNSTIVKGDLGLWEIEYNGQAMYVITDEAHNRMRIMAPIGEINIAQEINKEESQLKKKELEEQRIEKLQLLYILMESNFDRALDAKYAVQDNILFSVFTHPLAELRDHQFINALAQVKRLVETFGTSFSSSDLVFGENK